VEPLVTAGIIDEDEAREILNGDEILGDYDDLGDIIEPATEFQNKLANLQIERTNTGGTP